MRKIRRIIISSIMALCLSVTPSIGNVSAETKPAAPEKDKNEQVISWSVVTFGSYPQAEVVSKEMRKGVSSNELKEGDVVVSDELYKQLEDSSGWSNDGIKKIGSEKFKRIRKEDASFINSAPGSYQWVNSSTYHYFKFEPIRWRVIQVKGNDALLLADKGLDSQPFVKNYLNSASIGWGKSYVRDWLNAANENYFIQTAFDASEKNAITQTYVNYNIIEDSGMQKNKNTKDRIFLLSISEIASYGFSDISVSDEARTCRNTMYAAAMGARGKSNSTLSSNWMLRSIGTMKILERSVNFVTVAGKSSINGISTNQRWLAIRPALHLDLAKTDMYSYVGEIDRSGNIISETTTPETTASEIKTPEVVTSETTIPETTASEIKTPEVATSETAAPETTTSEIKTPEVTTPETTTPDVTTLETTVSEVTTPNDVTSEVTAPEIVTPTKIVNEATTELSTKKVSVTNVASVTKVLAEKISVGKTKVKKIKKTLGSKKAKITLKKISGAKYQVKVSTTKKFKKKKTVTKKVKKTKFAISSKKFKTKKVLYVRARAYKVVNGKTYYGKWSRVKVKRA